MNKKSKAFTLAEIMTVMVVIAIILVLTVFSNERQNSFNEKKVKESSSGFFSNVQNIYTEMLLYNSSNGSITGLKDKTGNGTVELEDIIEYFASPLNGKDTSCDNVITSSDTKTYKDNATCLKFPSKINAAFKYYPKCNATIKTLEYYVPAQNKNSSGKETRNSEKVCISIVYSTENSTGTLGKDVFVISLGKRFVK